MKLFSGTYTALVTPFKNGQIDYLSFEKLIKKQIADGIDGFVVNGTTGESPTLSKDEVSTLFKKAKSIVGASKKIILGTGSNSTQKTIEMTKLAEELHADAALVVVPYYNKPPQAGLIAHFKAVAESVHIPIILYNVPGRTITSLAAESVIALAEIKNIVGIKDATGDMEYFKKYKNHVKNDFVFLSGDDGTYPEFMKLGGDGVISVASHLMLAKDFSQKLDLIQMLFIEANPIPVKKALQLQGVIESAECRLPLIEMSQENCEKLQKLMTQQGFLHA